MAEDNNVERRKRPRRHLRNVLLCAAGAALAAAVLAFLFVGRWLVVEDPLEKAQAIAVLSGGMPGRALEAAKLYREGYAPRILLTHPAEPAASMAALGITYAGEDAYNAEILIRKGVPKEAIEILETPIRNTSDEMAVISRSLPAPSGATVIIVTSKAHTRRVRVLWRRLPQTQIRLLVHAVSDDSFNPRRWWATTGDALDVVREVLGILNAWAGLPLHPTG